MPLARRDLLLGLSAGLLAPAPSAPSAPPGPDRAAVVRRFGARIPRYWGTEAPGVLTRLADGDRRLALTFDACGSVHGKGYDADLIGQLRRWSVPATLFLNSRWIAANPSLTGELAADPLFELANHGSAHVPLSVTGRAAYGIAGTRDAGEVYDEVRANQDAMTAALPGPPRFFRPGTAHCDEVAAEIVTALGLRCTGFTVNADWGATRPAAGIAEALADAPRGAIVLAHMNHPEGDTARGYAEALPQLLDAGQEFTKLSGQGRSVAE
ncbi:polysaccharide deacetylase family protein [Streptomyces sp. NPDC087440]|uniref:polysaccharide deacetylase family protein n=1 Tax=Streptomyces sp. NPDC087440 TaxID=3365790 RepID=UPI00382C2DB3